MKCQKYCTIKQPRVVSMPILACLLGAVGITSCLAQSTAPPVGNAEQMKPPLEKTAAKSAPLAVHVSTDKKVYAVGERIKLTLTARNTTKEDLHLTFTSGQKYDFEIRRGAKPDGPSVWQWSNGMMFTMMMTIVTLQPGKTQTYSTVFIPRMTQDPKTRPLSAGAYTVIGTLAIGRPLARPQSTITFRVK